MVPSTSTPCAWPIRRASSQPRRCPKRRQTWRSGRRATYSWWPATRSTSPSRRNDPEARFSSIPIGFSIPLPLSPSPDGHAFAGATHCGEGDEFSEGKGAAPPPPSLRDSSPPPGCSPWSQHTAKRGEGLGRGQRTTYHKAVGDDRRL